MRHVNYLSTLIYNTNAFYMLTIKYRNYLKNCTVLPVYEYFISVCTYYM